MQISDYHLFFYPYILRFWYIYRCHPLYTLICSCAMNCVPSLLWVGIPMPLWDPCQSRAVLVVVVLELDILLKSVRYGETARDFFSISICMCFYIIIVRLLCTIYSCLCGIFQNLVIGTYVLVKSTKISSISYAQPIFFSLSSVKV